MVSFQRELEIHPHYYIMEFSKDTLVMDVTALGGRSFVTVKTPSDLF